MEGADWLEAFKLIGGAVGMLVIGLVGAFVGKKREDRPTGEGTVLDATVVDRSIFSENTNATKALADTVRELCVLTGRMIGLMEAETRRRQVEHEVQDELRKRGVAP